MSKEQRKVNREIRRKRRKERQEKFKALLNAANNVPDFSEEDYLQDWKGKFNQNWPVISKALDYAAFLKITGKKADEIINRIITIGNKMSEGNASKAEQDEFSECMEKIWSKVRMALSVLMVVANDKEDDIIEKILTIGDWISGINED